MFVHTVGLKLCVCVPHMPVYIMICERSCEHPHANAGEIMPTLSIVCMSMCERVLCQRLYAPLSIQDISLKLRLVYKTKYP